MTRNRLVMESRRFVEEQLAGLEQQLNEAEEALRAFREREGQVFLTDEARAALETFTKLEEQYNDVVRKRAEGERQISVLNRNDAVIGNQTGRIFTEEPYALLTILNQRLLDLIQERNTLLINYTTDHPQVLEQQKKIDNVRGEMVLELQAKLKTMQDREATLMEQRDRYRSRYFQFPRAAIEMGRLERDVKVNADLLATLKGKLQELQIKSAERIEEVTIVAPAIMPDAPDQCAQYGAEPHGWLSHGSVSWDRHRLCPRILRYIDRHHRRGRGVSQSSGSWCHSTVRQ